MGAETPATDVSGPVLGYIFDGAAAGVRRVTGLPGAALLSEPIRLETPLAGVISMWPDYLLAVSAGDRQVRMLEMASGVARAKPISGLAAGPDEMVLSPSGRTAALLYRAASKLVVLTGLPEAPQVAREMEIARSPVSLAVNDDGSLVAIGYDNAVLVSGRGGEFRWLVTLGRPAALAFSHSGADLLLADGTYHAVHWIRDVTGAVAVVRLAGERDGIAAPVGVAFSPDDRRALVANSAAETLAVIDLGTGLVSRSPCRSKPTGLYALGGGVYAFRGPARDEPLWLYEARASKARVFFAPPELKAPAAGERSGQ